MAIFAIYTTFAGSVGHIFCLIFLTVQMFMLSIGLRTNTSYPKATMSLAHADRVSRMWFGSAFVVSYSAEQP
jgi:hypothetical protein